MRLYTADELPGKIFIKSGVGTLDEAYPGLPVPGAVEVFGPPGSGKTLLALLYRPDIIVDVERSLSGNWVKVWSPTSKIAQTNDWEEVRAILEEFADSVRLIAIDSIAALDFGDDRPGSMSRLLGGWIVKNVPKLRGTCILLNNHVRVEWGTLKLSSPGGYGIKHAVDLRLRVRKGDLKSERWHEAIVEVVKSRICPTGGRASVFFNLQTGEVSREVMKE